jgi:hypothetical protein
MMASALTVSAQYGHLRVSRSPSKANRSSGLRATLPLADRETDARDNESGQDKQQHIEHYT